MQLMAGFYTYQNQPNNKQTNKQKHKQTKISTSFIGICYSY